MPSVTVSFLYYTVGTFLFSDNVYGTKSKTRIEAGKLALSCDFTNLLEGFYHVHLRAVSLAENRTRSIGIEGHQKLR